MSLGKFGNSYKAQPNGSALEIFVDYWDRTWRRGFPNSRWSHDPIWPKLSVKMHCLHMWFCLFLYLKMILTIKEICQWGEINPGKINFIGGEYVQKK